MNRLKRDVRSLRKRLAKLEAANMEEGSSEELSPAELWAENIKQEEDISTGEPTGASVGEEGDFSGAGASTFEVASTCVTSSCLDIDSCEVASQYTTSTCADSIGSEVASECSVASFVAPDCDIYWEYGLLVFDFPSHSSFVASGLQQQSMSDGTPRYRFGNSELTWDGDFYSIHAYDALRERCVEIRCATLDSFF